MKNAIILHGTGCTSEDYWYPYLKNRLEEKGYEVWCPQLPNSEEANLEEWLPFVLKNGKFNNETILIGHSAGATLILSLLENINTKISQAILVAGFLKGDSKILQKNYNWEKIKSNVEKPVIINSVNDPWGCNDKQGKEIFDKIGGTLIVNNEGHMGSTTYKQPYKEFPFLLKLIND